MEFEGCVKKDKKTSLWIAEVDSLDVMTQGTTKEDAIDMLKDAVIELIHENFPKKALKNLTLQAHFHGKKVFGISASDSRLLIALALRRQREREGISVREVTHRVNASSPNAYAQYEKGEVNISVNKLESLFAAINPDKCSRLRFV